MVGYIFPSVEKKSLIQIHIGPLVRIAPNYVICGDPIEVRRMWGVRSQFDRSPWYKGFQLDPPRDCTLSMRDEGLHTALRAKLAPGVSRPTSSGSKRHHQCLR